MANEAVLMFEYSLPVPMTVANGTGIEKGALLALSDPFTAAASNTSGAAVAGIAAAEKIASDGNTRLGVYREGIFKVVASGAVTVGEAVIFNPANKVAKSEINSEHIVGVALETAADGETFLMELKPGHYNLA